MGLYQLVATFESVTGLPEDRVQNVIHASCGVAADPAEYNPAMDAFRDFYIAQSPGASAALSNWMGQPLSRGSNLSSITTYFTDDASGATPLGSPVATLNFTLGGQAVGEDMAEEVAIVVSYNADLTDVPVTQTNPSPPPAIIRPQQRRRGRMYFGPLVAAVGTTVSGSTRPSATVRTDLTIAFKDLGDTLNAIAGVTFVVWSKADGALYPVVGGYVDDSFDTQRRRGPQATTRTTFTLA